MRLAFRPEAHQELLEAQAWYELRSPGLGFEFARAVDAALAMALRMPLAFPRIETDFRHVITRKFPYSIIYHPAESALSIPTAGGAAQLHHCNRSITIRS